MVWRAVFEVDFKNIRVLDIRFDPGILAILTKQLGEADILAIDIDEWSSENSIENCKARNRGGIEVKKRGYWIIREWKTLWFYSCDRK